MFMYSNEVMSTLKFCVVSIVNIQYLHIPFSSYTFKPIVFCFQSPLRRFIKRELLDVSPVNLTKLDVTDQKLWVSPKQVDIGMGATASLKVLP